MEAVARHPATPADTLASLLPPEPRSWNDNALVVALVRNPNTPVEVLRGVPELVLPNLANRDDHNAFEAGVALAERRDTPDEVLVALVSDPRGFTEFRKVLARQTTHDVLRQRLLLDRSEKVRRAALRSTEHASARSAACPSLPSDDRKRPDTNDGLSCTSASEGGRLDYVRAWLDAADDLGIDVVAPFTLSVDEQEVQCIALIADFGAFNGMGVLQGGVAEWREARELLDAASKLGYGFSFVRDPYRRYDRGLFVDTLNDWGWRRETRVAAEWYSGEPWMT